MYPDKSNICTIKYELTRLSLYGAARTLVVRILEPVPACQKCLSQGSHLPINTDYPVARPPPFLQLRERDQGKGRQMLNDGLHLGILLEFAQVF